MKNKIQIFCFHGISDKFSASYPSIPVKVFDGVCAFLKRNYFLVPLDEIGKNHNTKKPVGIITFDDGFYDFYENALPVLLKHKLHATQHLVVECVNTGHTHWSQLLNDILDAYFLKGIELELPEMGIKRTFKSRNEVKELGLKIFLEILKNGSLIHVVSRIEETVAGYVQNKRMMNWDEVLECTKFNISFGSHTCSHPTLTQLSDDTLKAELINSKAAIEQRLNYESCLSLAYPNGRFDERVREFGIDAGYKYLLTTMSRTAIMPDDQLGLPRFDIFNDTYWKNVLKILTYKYCK